MKISILIKESDINRFASIGLSAQKVILGSGPGNLSASMGRTITGETRINPVCPGWSLVSTRIGLVVVRDRKGVIIISDISVAYTPLKLPTTPFVYIAVDAVTVTKERSQRRRPMSLRS